MINTLKQQETHQNQPCYPCIYSCFISFTQQQLIHPIHPVLPDVDLMPTALSLELKEEGTRTNVSVTVATSETLTSPVLPFPSVTTLNVDPMQSV